jgi:hypothetical protein
MTVNIWINMEEDERIQQLE